MANDDVMHSEILKDIGTWLFAERTERHGDEPITAREDRRLRMSVYNKLTSHYHRRMPQDAFFKLREIAERALFSDAEINQK